MPTSVSKHLIFLPIILYLLSAPYLYANDSENNFPMQAEPSGEGYTGFRFLPRLGLQIGGKLFDDNKADHKMETNRIIDLDVFTVKNFVFSMSVNEILTFTDTGPTSASPYSIQYEMDFGNFGLELEYGILSLFFDHRCVNIINENETDDRRLRWYGTGIRWESYGMRPGQKDGNPHKRNNYLTDNFNYKISIDRSIHTRIFNYNYLLAGTLRYDLFNYYFLIPYFEGSFTALIDNRARVDRYYETGIRMHFDKGDITPFIGINHKHDIDYYNGIETDLYYAGLRMEALLGDPAAPGSTAGESFFPDFHLSAGYGKYINNDIINFNTDILIGMDLLRSLKQSPFMDYRLAHNSLAKHFGLYPRYIQHNFEGGISFRLDSINALIEPHYRYNRHDEGNFYNGSTEQAHEAVFRIRNIGMKTGFADNGIMINDTDFKWVNRMDWSASAGRTVKEYDYDYTWEYNLALRWNSFYFYKSIPYISAGISFLKDDDYDKIYNIEPGIRFRNVIYWMLFYRFEHRTAEDIGNGIYSNYHLTGIKIEI